MNSLLGFNQEDIERTNRKTRRRSLVPKKKPVVLGPTMSDFATKQNPHIRDQARRQGLHHAGYGIYVDKTGEPQKLVSADTNALEPIKLPRSHYTPKETKSDAIKNHVFDHIHKITQWAEQVHKALKPFSPHIDEDERNALSAYTGPEYREINKGLYDKQKAPEEHQAHVETLKNMIDENPAPFDYVTYTGLSGRYKPKNINKNKKYIFHGFVSTSLDPKTASSFFSEPGTHESVKGQGRNPPIMLQIHVKKGQKATYIGHHSSYDNEKETLLPPSSRIKIVSGPHKLSNIPWIDNASSYYGHGLTSPHAHVYVAHLLDHPEDDAEDVLTQDDKEQSEMEKLQNAAEKNKISHKEKLKLVLLKMKHGEIPVHPTLKHSPLLKKPITANTDMADDLYKHLKQKISYLIGNHNISQSLLHQKISQKENKPVSDSGKHKSQNQDKDFL